MSSIKKHFLFILILIIFMSSYFLAGCSVKEDKHNVGLSGKAENGVRIINVKASRYKFEPNTIIVKLGEKVRLLITAADVSHGFTLPEFKVNLTVDAKKTGSVEFLADKKGTFNAYCSIYCGSGHGHMHANFIVK